MTVHKDVKLNRAKCLSVGLVVKFNVIELLTQLKMGKKLAHSCIHAANTC